MNYDLALRMLRLIEPFLGYSPKKLLQNCFIFNRIFIKETKYLSCHFKGPQGKESLFTDQRKDCACATNFELKQTHLRASICPNWQILNITMPFPLQLK